MMFMDMAGEQTPDSGESRVRTVPWERSPCAKNLLAAAWKDTHPKGSEQVSSPVSQFHESGVGVSWRTMARPAYTGIGT